MYLHKENTIYICVYIYIERERESDVETKVRNINVDQERNLKHRDPGLEKTNEPVYVMKSYA